MINLFCYGSLLNSCQLGQHDTENCLLTPALIHGYRRAWSIDLKSGFTSVAVVKDGSSSCNGAIISVEQQSLFELDLRESNYTRTLISSEQLEVQHNRTWDKECFVYTVASHTSPTENTPILQSYIDVVLNGCMRIDKTYQLENYAFCREFIRSTIGWESPWVNDRKAPRYPRALVYEPSNFLVFNEIDSLLTELVSYTPT